MKPKATTQKDVASSVTDLTQVITRLANVLTINKQEPIKAKTEQKSQNVKITAKKQRLRDEETEALPEPTTAKKQNRTNTQDNTIGANTQDNTIDEDDDV